MMSAICYLQPTLVGCLALAESYIDIGLIILELYKKLYSNRPTFEKTPKRNYLWMTQYMTSVLKIVTFSSLIIPITKAYNKLYDQAYFYGVIKEEPIW